MLPSPDILNDYEHGKFVLSNLAAKRAKQLREGAPALVQVEGSNHPLTIALAEIAAGKIKPIMPDVREALIETDDIPVLIVDDTVPAEFGMLLPALEEEEAALIQVVDEEEAEIEGEADSDEALSLSDLVEDSEEEIAPTDEDSETLSLSDIAEQESAGDDDTSVDEE